MTGLIDQHVLGFDVFVDQTALMGLTERRCEANGDAQKPRQIARLVAIPLKNAVERLTTRVGENKECPPFVTYERQRLCGPGGLKFGCERIFVLKAAPTLRQWMFCGGSYDQDRRCDAVLSGAAKRELRISANWLQHVLRSICH